MPAGEETRSSPLPERARLDVRLLSSIGILQLSVVLVGIGRAKALAVLLGPAGFGVAATIDQVVLTGVQFGSLGLPFAALSFMTRSRGEGAEAFQNAFATFVSIVGVLAACTTVLAWAVLASYPSSPGDELMVYRTELQVALLGILPSALNSLFVSVLAVAQRPAAAAALALGMALGLAVCSVAGAALDGIGGLYVATGAFGIVSIPVSLACLHRTLGLRLPRRGIGLTRELRRTPQVILYASKVYVALVAYSVCLLLLRYLTLVDLGPAAAGLLQASLSVALTAGFIVAPMSNLYLVPLVNRKDPAWNKIKQANAYAGHVVVLMMIGAIPLVAFPNVVLGLLYTPAFTVAASVLFLFVVWQCLCQLLNVYQQLLIGLEDVVFTAIAAVVGLGTSALLATAFIPRLGLAGAAVALIAGAVSEGGLIAARLGLRHGMGVPARLVGQAGYLILAVVAGGALLGTRTAATLEGAALRAGFAISVSGSMWLLLRPAERALIASGPRGIRARWQAGKPT